MIGQIVKLKLYKAIDGVKEFKGELLSFDGKVKLMVDSTSLEFDLKEISKANLCDFE